MYEQRGRKFRNSIADQNIDAVMFVPGPNMLYFTGLKLKQSERISFLILTKAGKLAALVPQVEETKVSSIDGLAKVFTYTDEQGPANALRELKSYLRSTNRIGIEESQMRVNELRALESIDCNNLVNISGVVDSLRMYKDDEEISNLQHAVTILEESLDETLPIIKPGIKEMEVAAKLEYEMRKRGSEGTPFGTIVGSGYRGALPHGRAADKVIEDGELIVLDFGSFSKGYAGDITRTVAVGEIPNELKEIYQVVKEAQEAAIEVIKPGVTAHDVDEMARKVIRDHGYGEFFTHRTGHGLGLSGHEAPYMMQNNSTVLEEGMVFTVEPGIYIPGKAGVRIEDEILVTKTGPRNLMSYTKDLIVL